MQHPPRAADRAGRGRIRRPAPSKRRPRRCCGSCRRRPGRPARAALPRDGRRPRRLPDARARPAHRARGTRTRTASAVEERIRARAARDRRRRSSTPSLDRKTPERVSAIRFLKLCMFSPRDRELERGWPGRIEGDRVIQLAAQTLQAFFTGGGQAREHAEYRARRRRPARRQSCSPPSIRDFYAFEQHVRTARAFARPRRAAGVVRDPRLLLLQPGRGLRPRGRDPVPGGTRGARLRARARGRHRRRGGDRRLHGHERLVGARPPAGGDEGRARPVEGQGLRDQLRPRRRHAGRVRRHRGGDGRAGQRRGALARLASRTCTTRGRRSATTPRATRGCCRATSWARARLGRAASSSWATGAGCSPGDVVELEIEGIGVLRNTVGPRL